MFYREGICAFELQSRVGDIPICKAFLMPNTSIGITPNIPKSQPKEKKKKKAKEKDVIDLGRLDRIFMIPEAQPPNSWKWKQSPED